MNVKYTIIKVVLSIIIVVLAYLIYDSIMRPVRFNEATSAREAKVVARLIDLRTSQQFYKREHNRYTASFDTLIAFLTKGEIPMVKIIHATSYKAVDAAIILSPHFVDNTYGVNKIN